MSDAARLMDRIYAQQRHLYDATRKFYLLGRDGLVADLDPPDGARVLEIGCGTGRNLIKVARRYPYVECFGLDISRTMLMTARRNVARAGLTARIHLVEADATSFDPIPLFGGRPFERVILSYALSMIPPWREAVRRGADVVSATGSLHIVDFGDQADLPLAFKRLLRGWLARFHVTPRETLPEDVGALARDLGMRSSSKTLYRGYAVAVRLTR